MQTLRTVARVAVAAAMLVGCTSDATAPARTARPSVFSIRISPGPETYAYGRIPIELTAVALDSAGNVIPDTDIKWSIMGGSASQPGSSVAPIIAPDGSMNPASAWVTIFVADGATVYASHGNIRAAALVHRLQNPE